MHEMGWVVVLQKANEALILSGVVGVDGDREALPGCGFDLGNGGCRGTDLLAHGVVVIPDRCSKLFVVEWWSSYHQGRPWSRHQPSQQATSTRTTPSASKALDARRDTPCTPIASLRRICRHDGEQSEGLGGSVRSTVRSRCTTRAPVTFEPKGRQRTKPEAPCRGHGAVSE